MVEISILITTYNHGAYIAQAIESVLLQKSCPEYEILIGDDNSTDDTKLIIEQYRSKYPDIIKVYNSSNNIGMQKSLKRLIDNAKGEYIAILEGDDYWNSEFNLKIRHEALKNNLQSPMCFNSILILNEKTNEFYPGNDEDMEKMLDGKVSIVDMIKFINPIRNFSCCMYRASAIKKVPDIWFESNQVDWLFNMFVLEASKQSGIHIPESLSVYRIHPNGLWQRKSDDEKHTLMIKGMCEFVEIFKYKYTKYFMESILEIANRNIGYRYAIKEVKPKKIFNLRLSVLKRVFELQLIKYKKEQNK